MFQHPAELWNRIALEDELLRMDWSRAMFPLPPEDLEAAIAAELERVTAETGSSTVALAWMTVAPLLWEEPAIRAADVGVEPVNSLDEALAVAAGEYLLSPEETSQLRTLLLMVPPT